jgi:hypothetical protein
MACYPFGTFLTVAVVVVVVVVVVGGPVILFLNFLLHFEGNFDARTPFLH